MAHAAMSLADVAMDQGRIGWPTPTVAYPPAGRRELGAWHTAHGAWLLHHWDGRLLARMAFGVRGRLHHSLDGPGQWRIWAPGEAARRLRPPALDVTWPWALQHAREPLISFRLGAFSFIAVRRPAVFPAVADVFGLDVPSGLDCDVCVLSEVLLRPRGGPSVTVVGRSGPDGPSSLDTAAPRARPTRPPPWGPPTTSLALADDPSGARESDSEPEQATWWPVCPQCNGVAEVCFRSATRHLPTWQCPACSHVDRLPAHADGCPYRSRCRHATDACVAASLSVQHIDLDHTTTCVRWRDLGPRQTARDAAA